MQCHLFKVLGTRFVRTWRGKHNSKSEAIWLRRSRFVAHEFAWLEPERESSAWKWSSWCSWCRGTLCCWWIAGGGSISRWSASKTQDRRPAERQRARTKKNCPPSGSIISRVLATVFLERREKKNMVMASLDVRDAFWTVKRELGPYWCKWNNSQFFFGEDAWSLLYRVITSFLKSKLDLEEHPILAFFVQKMDLACGWKARLCVGQVRSEAQSCIWYFSSMHWEARWWANIFETTVHTSWWWKIDISNAWEAHHPALQFAWIQCSKPE